VIGVKPVREPQLLEEQAVIGNEYSSQETNVEEGCFH